MKRLALTLLLLAVACVGARGQEAAGQADEEKRRDIKRLLTLTRGTELGEQIVRQSLDGLRENLAFLPEESRAKVMNIFEEEMLKEFSAERMIELVLPIYAKHLTSEDVKSLIVFYETPTGKKLLDAMPSITRESYEAGSERGRQAGLRAMARVAQEGLLPPPPPASVEKPKPVTRTPAKKTPPRKKRS